MRDFGITMSAERVTRFLGAHPPIEKAITLASAGAAVDLVAGTVLGRITASGKYVAWAHGANDGSQTPAAVLQEDVTVPAAGDEKSSAYVHGEFMRSGLTFDPTADAAGVDAAILALADAGLYVK